MADTTVITENLGQYRITIPKYIIKALRLNKGDKLCWTIASKHSATITPLIKTTAIYGRKRN